MKASRKDQLKALKMPKKSMAEDEAATDLESLGSPDDSAAPEDASALPADESHGLSESPALDDVSDDDLVAEMKKRGLLEGEMDPKDGLEMEMPKDKMMKA